MTNFNTLHHALTGNQMVKMLARISKPMLSLLSVVFDSQSIKGTSKCTLKHLLFLIGEETKEMILNSLSGRSLFIHDRSN